MCPRGSIGYANKTNEPFILLPNLLVVAEGNNDAIQPCFDFSVISTELYESIEDGDIGIINNGNMIRVILSRRANHNTVLVTERCNNLCLFCSQPPKKSNDDWLLTQSALAIASFGLMELLGSAVENLCCMEMISFTSLILSSRIHQILLCMF